MSTTTQTTCSYCSVGCNINFEVTDGAVTKVRPVADYPVNLGKCCPKGFNLIEAFQSEDRGTEPLLRGSDGKMEAVSWDTALGAFTDRFKAIKREHGEHSVAVISTGQITTEDFALLGVLTRFGMNVHCDGNTRQCMASAVVAYKQAFGFDAPPFSYKDLEESDVLVFVGANPVIAHPIIWNRVKMNPHNPELIVLDPRRTKTAQAATLHLPLKPKSDLLVLYAIARILIERDWVDADFIKQHTADFDSFREHVMGIELEEVVQESGLPAETLISCAEKIHAGKRVSFWWTMGVNQSHQGVRTAQAIINLALITGNIGRPGTGPNSITGQSNAMGSRLFSNTTSLLGGRDFANAEHRADVAHIMKIDEAVIPHAPTLPYNKIIEGVKDGTIKGLWFVATNPVHSWIDKESFIPLMEQLDFLVVQDLYATTDTAQLADLFLPAAGSGEKPGGCFINSERRLGAVRQIRKPPGQSLPDFDIFLKIAHAWGCDDMVKDFSTPETAFQLLRELSRGRPCDITGVKGYDHMIELGGIQWPYPENNPPAEQERRLFADGRFYTPDGKAKFIFEEHHAMLETCSAEYPFTLLTGRGSVAQFHTQTRTGKVARLQKLYPQEAYAQINAKDAERLGIVEKDLIRVVSRRGTVTVQAAISDEVMPMYIFMPMHYFETNKLTFPVFDPYSGQPSYKFGAIRVEKAS